MPKKIILDIPVQYGGISIGQNTARISMKVSREALNIVAADEVFCDRRLTGLLQLGGADDSQGQTSFIDPDVELTGAFDVHRFSASTQWYSTGATFSLKEVVLMDLARFSKGSGRLKVFETGDIPDAVKTPKPAEVEIKTIKSAKPTKTAKSPKAAREDKDAWRVVSLSELFSGVILKSLNAADLFKVGDLHDFQQPDKAGRVKQIQDIKGIGEAKATQIEDTMLEFWQKHK